jgi:WD40 repeat protein
MASFASLTSKRDRSLFETNPDETNAERRYSIVEPIYRLISPEGHSAEMNEPIPYYMPATIASAMRDFEASTEFSIKPIGTDRDNGAGITCIAISNDGKKTALGLSDGSVYYINNETREMIKINISGGPQAVAFTNDNQYVIAGSNNEMRMINTNNRRNTTINSRKWVNTIAVHPTQNDIFVVGYYHESEIEIFKLTGTTALTQGILKHLTPTQDILSKSVNSIAFRPDGESFVSAGSDGRLRVWKSSDLTVSRTIQHQDMSVFHRSVTSVVNTGKHIVSAGEDGILNVWGENDGGLKSSVVCVPGLKVNSIAYKYGTLVAIVNGSDTDGNSVFLYSLNENGLLILRQKFRGPTPFMSVAIGPYFGIGASRDGIDPQIVLGGIGGILMKLSTRGSREHMYWLERGIERSNKRKMEAIEERLSDTDKDLSPLGQLIVELPEELQKKIKEYGGGKRTKRKRKQKRINKKSRTSKRR